MTTEIQTDLVGAGSVTLVPDWLRIPLAVKYSGISRAKLYTYLATGEIKSFVLKKKGAIRGTRFVSRRRSTLWAGMTETSHFARRVLMEACNEIHIFW